MEIFKCDCESITFSTNISAWHIVKSFRRTTSTNIILAETGAGEDTLRSRFVLLTSKYILKIFALDSHPLIDKLFAFLWYSRRTSKINPSEKFFLFRSFSIFLRYKSYIIRLLCPEALAILHILKYILTSTISKSLIFIDSKSVTEALLSINLAHSLSHIIFAIPAHSSILGNETADYLAKKVISKECRLARVPTLKTSDLASRTGFSGNEAAI
ncbi:hypothetical protein ACFW04_013580 [Cataglyphis niger]